MTAVERYFAQLYRSDDPYGYRYRWYEQRKRALLLAALPRLGFESAWEWGCSNGELTVELALRCDRVWATDLSARAVELASARTAALDHVTVQQSRHPAQWPDRRFDLVVFSEVGYFLTHDELEISVRRFRHTLAEDGALIACHWRRPFAAAPCDGEEVHRALRDHAGLARLCSYEDDDFLLESWGASARSVAMREGLR